MSQKELVQASIQVEAARELSEMVRPVVRKIVCAVRSRRVESDPQTDVALQPATDARIGRIPV